MKRILCLLLALPGAAAAGNWIELDYGEADAETGLATTGEDGSAQRIAGGMTSDAGGLLRLDARRESVRLDHAPDTAVFGGFSYDLPAHRQ